MRGALGPPVASTRTAAGEPSALSGGRVTRGCDVSSPQTRDSQTPEHSSPLYPTTTYWQRGPPLLGAPPPQRPQRGPSALLQCPRTALGPSGVRTPQQHARPHKRSARESESPCRGAPTRAGGLSTSGAPSLGWGPPKILNSSSPLTCSWGPRSPRAWVSRKKDGGPLLGAPPRLVGFCLESRQRGP